MRSRRLGFWCVMFCAFSVSTVFASDGSSADAGTCSAVTEAGSVVAEDGVSGIPGTVPVSPDAKVHRVTIIGGPGGDTIIEQGTVSGTGTACREDPSAVYCNTLSNTVFGPDAANTPFADDIALAGVAGCLLDRYKIRVTGDRRQDGTGLGSYTVTFGLYETCPGASVMPPILGTNTQFTVPAANAGDIYEITFVPTYGINLPSNLYLGVSFSRQQCGIVLGAPALLGFSADRFDYPGFSCAAGLGEFPAAPHASFYAEIYVTGGCDRAFAGYKNTNDAGNAWSAGSRVYFADDLMLDVAECNMVALEIGHKGTGFVRVDLHTFLSDSDPGNGGLIPGTRMDCFSSGSNPQICRQEFDPPIPLVAPNPWIVFKSNSGSMGPILTCKHAAPGITENIYMVHSNGAWGVQALGDASACWAGFEVTILCEGEPPAGACCDMNMTDEAGESVCRDNLAEMNCAFPVQWEEGAICSSICEEGTNDGLPCTRQVDCPYGECPGPFAHPCGVAACCKPDGDCENLTENLCDEVPPVEDKRLFQKGQFCNEGLQRCPFPACLQREGECTQARSAWCVGGERDGLLCDHWAYPSECPGYSCVGGTYDGEECDQDAECPNGYCDDYGICAGGSQDGQPCNPDAECSGGECLRARCVGEVGCEDPYCCTDVCSDPYNVYCCTVYWDKDCATEAFRLCTREPSNDECYNPISEVKGAQLITVPGTEEGDGIQATTGTNDPDFCCYEVLQGGTAPVKNLWYKFVAPAAQDYRCEGGDRDGYFCDPNAADPHNHLDGCPDGICNALPVSVSIDTCCSNPREGGPADDSLLQVYALADSDRGLCSNGLDICSVAAGLCADGLPCVFDEQWGCSNLMPIACSDDAGLSCVCGPVVKPYNSRVCAPDLNPGETYYFQVAAKTSDNIGVWQLRVASPCTQSDPPQDNDLCFKPTQLSGENVEVEFDLTGGTLNGPATLDCPEPPPNPLCTSTMKVDLWYDWVAPFNGKATIQTCGFDEFGQGLDELTPDTSLVVYDGCECPVGMPMFLTDGVFACSDFQPTPCFLGSKLVDLTVEQGHCYKIRLGGTVDTVERLDGSLKIDLTSVECPAGPVTFVDPPDGLIDARQPHPTADANDLQGYDTFILDAPAGAAVTWADCWSFCDSDDGTENGITGIVDNGDGSYTVTLASPILAGHVSTITYTDDTSTEHRGVFISHPANVNSDSQAAPSDILAIIDCLNFVGPACEPHQCDVDRSGVCGPPDILRVIDLLNGAGAYDPWLNSPVPVCDDTNCCPL